MTSRLRTGSRVRSDAAWIACGQIASALATVIGVRLLTQFVAPATFGFVSLALGAVALCVNVVCTPLVQATLHYYPAAANKNSIDQLRNALARSFARIGTWVLILIAISALGYALFAHGSLFVVILIAMLLASDSLRSVVLAFLNASENHRRYALLVAADACARPLFATLAVLMFGDSPIVVMSAYLLSSFAILVVYGATARLNWKIFQMQPPLGKFSAAEDMNLEQKIWRYALPLIPLGVINWANGLGDRYLIGGILSVADAGIYAAAYGLASRPFLMISGAIELVVRPRYQNNVSNGLTSAADGLFRRWLTIVVAVCSVGVIVFAICSNQIAYLFLGARFQSGALLMPWIASGYALLIISYVFERVCYAHNQSYRVLLIQLCTVSAGLIVTAVGTVRWGLLGAAVAVPVYFSIQLGVAGVFAFGALKQARHVAVSG